MRKTFHISAWCKKNTKTLLEAMTIAQIDANLTRFYAEARKKTWRCTKKTLLGCRHAIERYLNQPPYISDPRFKRFNEMLDAQLVAPEEKQRKYSAQTNN
jgi:hypothetical protein